MKAAPLTLEPRRWYGWQMLPGYTDRPYVSPIRVRKVTPRGSGQGRLELAFFNAFYATGVQTFTPELRILRRTPRYILADILDANPEAEPRAAVVLPITQAWLAAFCPKVLQTPEAERPDLDEPEALQQVLSEIFGVG